MSLCNVETSQLVVIDIQDRLASAMPKDVLDKVVKNSNVLINAAKELDIPVIHSEQYPKGLGNTVGYQVPMSRLPPDNKSKCNDACRFLVLHHGLHQNRYFKCAGNTDGVHSNIGIQLLEFLFCVFHQCIGELPVVL